VKWIRPGNRYMVRAKADLSSRRVGAALITATLPEQTAVATAFDSERPVRMEALRNGEPGLLHRLGADEALIVPLNREFATPALLLLDRSISTRPIHLLQDSDKATTLALTTTLLTENLLLKRRRTRAQKFALTDPLTRLFNRTMGIRTLELEITRARVSLKPLTVLMVDLDNFKRLNDTHGHVLGDHALRATAEALHKTLRRSDTLCRYGGEEFLVVLPSTHFGGAVTVAERIWRDITEKRFTIDSSKYHAITVSIGVGLYPSRDVRTKDALVRAADGALQQAKRDGGNRICVFQQQGYIYTPSVGAAPPPTSQRGVGGGNVGGGR
jgi:diguanylate cyclase (GGDEF)-like protein